MNSEKRWRTWGELHWAAKTSLVLSPFLGLFGAYWVGNLFLFLPIWVFLFVLSVPGPSRDMVVKTDSILNCVSTHGELLQVDAYQVPLHVIRQVAISELDGERGFLSFPQTSKIPHNYLFPLGEIDALRDWFRLHTPTLKITT